MNQNGLFPLVSIIINNLLIIIIFIGAKHADATERLVELARPKRIAEGYEPSRDVIWKVTTGAKTATASTRYKRVHDITL